MKIKQLLLAAAAMVLAVACNDPVEPTPEVQLSVEPAQVEYLAEGGEQTVALTANAAWTAEPSAEWIKLDVTSGTEGQSVKVTANPNEAEEAREGKVVFTAGDKNAELVVRQAAAEAESTEASATIVVGEPEEGRMGYMVPFTVTTVNVTAAAFNYWVSEDINEDITAEFVFELAEGEIGGAMFWDDELNTEASFQIQGVAVGHEYTIVVAYKDAEGNTYMTTATVTVGEAGGEGDDSGETVTDYTIEAATKVEVIVDNVEVMETEVVVTDEVQGFAIRVVINTTEDILDNEYYTENAYEGEVPEALIVYAAVTDLYGFPVAIMNFAGCSVWLEEEGYVVSIDGTTEAGGYVSVWCEGVAIEGLQ